LPISWPKRATNRLQQLKWINGIMHHVERRDHIKLRRQPFRDIAFLETHPVRYARFARIHSRARNGRTKVVVAHVARPRKGLRQLDERMPASASDVCQIAT